MLYVFYKLPKNLRLEMAVGFIIAVFIAVVIDKLAGKLYYDPRPFVSHHVSPLINHAADNGFPSEHTIAAMTISTLLYFYRKKFALVAFVLTVIIGSARVAAHVHSPIDIIGGLVIGAIAGAGGYYLAPKIITAFGSKKT